MECKAAIDAGICGFHTHVKTVSNDGQNVVFEIQSGCDKIKRLSEVLAEKGIIDAYLMRLKVAVQGALYRLVYLNRCRLRAAWLYPRT
ncbi:MAG: hypothetical protein A2Y07_07245 [Planctomycetes bacterium GWF2_50_10]|nr:MAG: hypothetical protein A2Y07_07245 [Planctomycetes bacterium GWF2_50_10]